MKTVRARIAEKVTKVTKLLQKSQKVTKVTKLLQKLQNLQQPRRNKMIHKSASRQEMMDFISKTNTLSYVPDKGIITVSDLTNYLEFLLQEGLITEDAELLGDLSIEISDAESGVDVIEIKPHHTG